MSIAPLSYVLAAIFLLGFARSLPAQVQRTLVTEKGETRDTPLPHPLTWWTQDPLRLDASGMLMLGYKANDGHIVTAQDYQVQQSLTALGTISDHRILQVLTIIHARSNVIIGSFSAAQSPPGQWKSLLVETEKGMYEEIYTLQLDLGGLKSWIAEIYGSGPDAILGTYDRDGGNGGGCDDGYWWFDHAGAHTVDFTKLYRAIAPVVRKGTTYTPNCWALHPKEAYLESAVQRLDATCHACGIVGIVRVSYRIHRGVAIPVSVRFEPQEKQSE